MSLATTSIEPQGANNEILSGEPSDINHGLFCWIQSGGGQIRQPGLAQLPIVAFVIYKCPMQTIFQFVVRQAEFFYVNSVTGFNQREDAGYWVSEILSCIGQRMAIPAPIVISGSHLRLE